MLITDEMVSRGSLALLARRYLVDGCGWEREGVSTLSDEAAIYNAQCEAVSRRDEEEN